MDGEGIFVLVFYFFAFLFFFLVSSPPSHVPSAYAQLQARADAHEAEKFNNVLSSPHRLCLVRIVAAS